MSIAKFIRGHRQEQQKLMQRVQLRQNVQDWAEQKTREQAKAVMAGQNWQPETREQFMAVLVRYTRGTAADTFDALNLHGHLNITRS